MNVLQRIGNLFRRGGATMSIVPRLGTVLDHPKINIPTSEYRRLEDTLQMYSNNLPAVEYVNSKGNKKTRSYMSINMVKNASDLMAKLVFNEKCEINIDNNVAKDFIDKVFAANNFQNNFAEYLEPMFAFGGLAIRPYIENGTVKFTWATGLTFIPLKSDTNGIEDGALISKTKVTENKKTYTYTLFEFHEWVDNDTYRITNELYQSENENEVGMKVPLRYLYPDMEEESFVDNLTRSLFVYIKPSGFNNLALNSPFGLGLCDNAKATITQINDAYDRFNWEIRMGNRKVIAPESMLSSIPDETGRMKQSFDDETDIFVSLNIDPTGFKQPVDITADIRSEQYISSINHFLKTFEMDLKLSSGTFTFDGKVMKTATEVVSENSRTYKTRSSHLINVETGLKKLIVSILELASGFGLYNGPILTQDDIKIKFDDGVFQTKEVVVQKYQSLMESGLVSRVKAMQEIWEISEDDARAMLRQIRDEERMMDMEHSAVMEQISMLGRGG